MSNLALVEARPTSPVPGLRRIIATDGDELAYLLTNALKFPQIWSIEGVTNPIAWFAYHYTNPCNLVFDIGNGAGFVAFLKTIPGWRAQLYGAAWRREGYRQYALWRAAATAAMLANDLVVIDAFVAPENTISRRACERAGMKMRGVIKAIPQYNSMHKPVLWYEIDRADLGLPPVEVFNG